MPKPCTQHDPQIWQTEKKHQAADMEQDRLDVKDDTPDPFDKTSEDKSDSQTGCPTDYNAERQLLQCILCNQNQSRCARPKGKPHEEVRAAWSLASQEEGHASQGTQKHEQG